MQYSKEYAAGYSKGWQEATIANEFYLLSKGVRPMCFVDSDEDTILFKQRLARWNQPHPSGFIKLGCIKANGGYIIFDKEFRAKAKLLVKAWNKQGKLRDRIVGLLLGYRPDIVEYFCKNCVV